MAGFHSKIIRHGRHNHHTGCVCIETRIDVTQARHSNLAHTLFKDAFAF
jgi:hypothetical protein